MKSKLFIDRIIDKQMEDAEWQGRAKGVFKMIHGIVTEKPVPRGHIEMIKRLVAPYVDQSPAVEEKEAEKTDEQALV